MLQRHQHRYFSVSIVKFLRTVFLQNTFCSLYFSEIFIWWYNSLDVFGYKIDIFHISCAIALFSFITLVLESGLHGYFVFVFILKFLVSITFTRITTSESETASSIKATSPSSLLWKMWIWVFWILCFSIIFL